MKKKIIILDGLFIYLLLLLLLSLTVFGDSIIIEWLWDNFYFFIAFLPLGLLLYEMIMFIITIIFTIISVDKNYNTNINNAISLAKIQMIIRLIQIPAYVIIFLMGIACIITIFTIGISIALVILDFISIVTTGISSIAVYTILYKCNLISNKEKNIYSILSFVYCLDVIVSVISYRKIVKNQ